MYCYKYIHNFHNIHNCKDKEFVYLHMFMLFDFKEAESFMYFYCHIYIPLRIFTIKRYALYPETNLRFQGTEERIHIHTDTLPYATFQVLFMALLLSFIFKKPSIDREELDQDEENLVLEEDEEWITPEDGETTNDISTYLITHVEWSSSTDTCTF